MLDKFGRKINYLRLSVTDRCDLRCSYCMPKKNMSFYPKIEILSISDLKKITNTLIKSGIKTIRITGGEPLIRKDILEFLEFVCLKKKENKLKEVLITTNGTQLKKYAKKIAYLGINRINISLDSLDPVKFNYITNGGKLEKVLEGIYEAKKNKIDIKINTVLLKDFNESEILKFTKWCAKNNFKQSFIEIMPVGKLEIQRKNQFLPISVAKSKIKEMFGLQPLFLKTNGPSKYFQTEKFGNVIGFISPLTENFCASCNRIRVTSNGVLYPCLGDNGSVNLKKFLHKDEKKLFSIISDIIYNKPEKHLFSVNDETYINSRFMNTTGG